MVLAIAMLIRLLESILSLKSYGIEVPSLRGICTDINESYFRRDAWITGPICETPTPLFLHEVEATGCRQRVDGGSLIWSMCPFREVVMRLSTGSFLLSFPFFKGASSIKGPLFTS